MVLYNKGRVSWILSWGNVSISEPGFLGWMIVGCKWQWYTSCSQIIWSGTCEHPSRLDNICRHELGLMIWQSHLHERKTMGVDSLRNIQRVTNQWKHWSGSCRHIQPKEVVCSRKLGFVLKCGVPFPCPGWLAPSGHWSVGGSLKTGSQRLQGFDRKISRTERLISWAVESFGRPVKCTTFGDMVNNEYHCVTLWGRQACEKVECNRSPRVLRIRI